MIGIIGAMKVELEALKARLQDVTVTRISGVDIYSGKLHGTEDDGFEVRCESHY